MLLFSEVYKLFYIYQMLSLFTSLSIRNFEGVMILPSCPFSKHIHTTLKHLR